MNEPKDEQIDAEQDEIIMKDSQNEKIEVNDENQIIEEITKENMNHEEQKPDDNKMEINCDCEHQEPIEDIMDLKDHFYELARQIVNERFPEFKEHCINMNSQQYWDHVLQTTCIDIYDIMDEFIMELEMEFAVNRNKTHYEILKDYIITAADDFEN